MVPHHRIELTTRQNYRYVLDKHILPAFGGYKMIALQPADVRGWLTTLKEAGVKPATVKYCLSVLSAVLTTAFNDQITALHPCAGIKAPTVPKATRRIITPDQFTRIHQALPTPELRLLVETDIETGLRWGELIELRVHDLDLARSQVVVSRVVIEVVAKHQPDGKRFIIKNYPKDRKPRHIGLSTHIRDLLAAHTTGMTPDQLLFTTPSPSETSTDIFPAAGDSGEGSEEPVDLGLTEPTPTGRTYRHGTLTAYSSAPCRRPHCRQAYATYRAQRRASGADPTRAAIPALASGDRHIPPRLVPTHHLEPRPHERWSRLPRPRPRPPTRPRLLAPRRRRRPPNRQRPHGPRPTHHHRAIPPHPP